MKTCTKCGELKDTSCFNKKKSSADGLSSQCKSCRNITAQIYRDNNKDKIKETMHKHYIKNTDNILLKHKTYKEKNSEIIKDKRTQSYEDNPEYFKSKSKKYRDDNPGYFNEYSKTRRNNDSLYALTCSLRTINQRIKNLGGKKSCRTNELLGCTWNEAYNYLETLFQENMTWENHGMFGWHIDHIIPLDAIKDINNIDEIKKICHYTNLQPLWCEDNLHKNNKIC